MTGITLRSVNSAKPSGSVVKSGPSMQYEINAKPSGLTISTKPNARANKVYSASTTLAVTYNEVGLTYNEALMLYNDSSFVIMGSGGDRGPSISNINTKL